MVTRAKKKMGVPKKLEVKDIVTLTKAGRVPNCFQLEKIPTEQLPGAEDCVVHLYDIYIVITKYASAVAKICQKVKSKSFNPLDWIMYMLYLVIMTGDRVTSSSERPSEELPPIVIVFSCDRHRAQPSIKREMTAKRRSVIPSFMKDSRGVEHKISHFEWVNSETVRRVAEGGVHSDLVSMSLINKKIAAGEIPHNKELTTFVMDALFHNLRSGELVRKIAKNNWSIDPACFAQDRYLVIDAPTSNDGRIEYFGVRAFHMPSAWHRGGIKTQIFEEIFVSSSEQSSSSSSSERRTLAVEERLLQVIGAKSLSRNTLKCGASVSDLLDLLEDRRQKLRNEDFEDDWWWPGEGEVGVAQWAKHIVQNHRETLIRWEDAKCEDPEPLNMFIMGHSSDIDLVWLMLLQLSQVSGAKNLPSVWVRRDGGKHLENKQNSGNGATAVFPFVDVRGTLAWLDEYRYREHPTRSRGPPDLKKCVETFRCDSSDEPAAKRRRVDCGVNTRHDDSENAGNNDGLVVRFGDGLDDALSQVDSFESAVLRWCSVWISIYGSDYYDPLTVVWKRRGTSILEQWHFVESNIRLGSSGEFTSMMLLAFKQSPGCCPSKWKVAFGGWMFTLLYWLNTRGDHSDAEILFHEMCSPNVMLDAKGGLVSTSSQIQGESRLKPRFRGKNEAVEFIRSCVFVDRKRKRVTSDT